jgi:hypothetical protein
MVHVPPAGVGDGIAARRREWACIVVIDGAPNEPVKLRVLRPLDAAAQRAYRARLEPAPDCDAVPLGSAALLVSCASSQDVIVEAAQEGMADGRVGVEALAATLLVPVIVRLTPDRVVTGRVEGADGRRASETNVDIAELIVVADDRGQPRTIRQTTRDLVTDAEGWFEIRGLGDGTFELLAVHGQYGRARVQFTPDDAPLVVHLVTPARVVGRIVTQGVPAPGARISVALDVSASLTSGDPFETVVPEVTGGPDGRFELALPRGAVEIRATIGNQTVRRPLPVHADGMRVDLGDIDVASGITVTVAYTGDEACNLAAAGPFGRSGLSVVNATVLGVGARQFVLPEPGTWVLTATCGSHELPVEPRSLDIPARVLAWSAQVRLVPRQ